MSCRNWNYKFTKCSEIALNGCINVYINEYDRVPNFYPKALAVQKKETMICNPCILLENSNVLHENESSVPETKSMAVTALCQQTHDNTYVLNGLVSVGWCYVFSFWFRNCRIIEKTDKGHTVLISIWFSWPKRYGCIFYVAEEVRHNIPT